MRKLAVGDLAIYRVNPDYESEQRMDMYDGCIVRVIEIIEEEFMYWDYFVIFPDNRILEVHEEELEPAFCW